jgi:hypothetical protein
METTGRSNTNKRRNVVAYCVTFIMLLIAMAFSVTTVGLVVHYHKDSNRSWRYMAEYLGWTGAIAGRSDINCTGRTGAITCSYHGV